MKSPIRWISRSARLHPPYQGPPRRETTARNSPHHGAMRSSMRSGIRKALRHPPRTRQEKELVWDKHAKTANWKLWRLFCHPMCSIKPDMFQLPHTQALSVQNKKLKETEANKVVQRTHTTLSMRASGAAVLRAPLPRYRGA